MIDGSSTLEQLYHRRGEFYFGKSPWIVVILLVMLTLGLGYLVLQFRVDPQRAWGALLLNNLFFFLLSLGGVVFGLIQDACGAQWSRPIKRFFETFGIGFHLTAAGFLVLLVAIQLRWLEAESIYAWIADPHMLDHFPGKNQWLTADFFCLRVASMLALMSLVVFWVQWQHHLADKAFGEGRLEDARRLASLASQRLRFWSAPCLVVLSILFTFVMIDLVMALAPLWFSTLWAGWLFAVMMQLTLSVTLVGMFVIKNKSLGSLIDAAQFHDMGKLLYGFSIFWAYLTFAHVLTYWYGNVPEETEYFLHRLHEPWATLLVVIMVGAFIIPLFVLIPKAAKWTALVMVPVAVLIIGSQWLAHVVMVQPEVAGHMGAHIPITELAALGVMSAVTVGLFYAWGRTHLMVSLHDPLLERHLHSAEH